MNKPYVKEYQFLSEDDTSDFPEKILVNPITKNNPYIHQFRSNRGTSKKRYIILNNPLTGEFTGKLKYLGNNRKNTSSRRNKNSRTYFY